MPILQPAADKYCRSAAANNTACSKIIQAINPVSQQLLLIQQHRQYYRKSQQPDRAANSMPSAKYINTPETKIYSKSKNIYGLFDAKNNIVENDQVLIVEGYTDVIALHQAGYQKCCCKPVEQL